MFMKKKKGLTISSFIFVLQYYATGFNGYFTVDNILHNRMCNIVCIVGGEYEVVISMLCLHFIL